MNQKSHTIIGGALSAEGGFLLTDFQSRAVMALTVLGRNVERVTMPTERTGEEGLGMSAFDIQVGGSHYKDFAIQPTEFIHKNNLSFLQGCIIKRICRYKNKNGLEDLKKIKHEVDMLIELEGYGI